jgi:peptidylprolyl isomerase
LIGLRHPKARLRYPAALAMKRLLSIPIVLTLAAGLAACGSSATPGVLAPPQGGATQAAITRASTPTTPTTPTTTVTTPKPPSPLSKEPVIHTPGGTPPKKLVVKNLITGTGPAAKAGDTITVNYVGALYKNGKVFDSSWQRHSTFTTSLSSGAGGVIAGWVQGLQGMRVDGRRELIIPPSLAYGKTGSGPIPPNSTLIFIIDLLAVKP